jgi:hypothetical protein
MLRKDIRAGVVYAAESRYGAPRPVAFLQDAAATLFESVLRGSPRACASQSGRAKRGRGWDGRDRGYAAVTGSGDKKAAAALLADIDPAAELKRFRAGAGAPEGLSFRIVTSLADISRTYAEAIAAYETAQARDRAAARQQAAEETAREARATSLVAALAAAGFKARTDFTHILLSFDETERLVAKLAARTGAEPGDG